MRWRVPIRWRLVATSVALVLAVLVLVGGTVIALEQRSLDEDLSAQAALEARSLLAVAARAEAPLPEVPVPTDSEEGSGTLSTLTLPTVTSDDSGTSPEGDQPESESESEGEGNQPSVSTRAATATATPSLDPSTEPYLVRRSASETLLAVGTTPGIAVINQERARALVPLLSHAAGTTQMTVGGIEYTVAVDRDQDGITSAAAVPRTEADERIQALIRALAFAGGLGAALTILLAWLAARQALRPLTVMTARAESVTAGRLDQRVGPVGGEDEIARLTHAIDAMLARLEGSFAAQQRFVQDASHELRTPITIARGHLEVLNPEREDAASVQSEIDLAVDELDRMGRLVERLLTLAQAGSELTTKRDKVDVNLLAQEALARVSSLIVDVLVNLLNNAERHTKPDGLILLRVECDDRTVRIMVRDDGEGIPTELLPTIFNRFTRADAARTRDAGGAGLGLAICHAYVVAQSGTISVASQPGQGATFTITLPRSS
ncbi:MAG: ATP-binding protein [Actinobacteria bacterium]|nr:ATP-binding protein [Actinomycetota bacterium]